MKITMKGCAIYLDVGEDISDALSLVCKCGHTLGSHAFTYFPVNGKTALHTSQCLSCGVKDKKFVCEQFRV